MAQFTARAPDRKGVLAQTPAKTSTEVEPGPKIHRRRKIVFVLFTSGTISC
jgi:hypothetical protein